MLGRLVTALQKLFAVVAAVLQLGEISFVASGTYTLAPYESTPTLLPEIQTRSNDIAVCPVVRLSPVL